MLAFIFTFQENLWGQISVYVGEIFSDMLPLLVILISVILGFFVIERIIGIIKK